MMATGEELWRLSQARLKSAKTLMQASDWDAASYMMGYALETALKAAACKSLHLAEYPERTGSSETKTYFMTHDLSQLLIVSGMSHIFEPSGPPEFSSKWSEFLQFYPANWVSRRYSLNNPQLHSISVSRLYEILYEDRDSIIKKIQVEQQW